jgi:hypothetical protein
MHTSSSYVCTLKLAILIASYNGHKMSATQLLTLMHSATRVSICGSGFFYSRSEVGVGVTNYSGVGVAVGTGVGTDNLSGADLGADFYCLNFA